MKKFFLLVVLALLIFAHSFALSPITATGGMMGTCVGSSTSLIDSGFAGGAWSSSNVAIATIDSTGGIYGVSAGTTTITYAFGSSYVTATFTVSSAPAAITGMSSVCPGSSVALTDATSGGTWSSSAPSLATVNTATGVVTGISAGWILIYYSTGPGCYAIDTFTVGTTSVFITGDTLSPLCGGATTLLTASVPGGHWSSGATTIATVNVDGEVFGITAGLVTISYAVTGACGTSVAVFPLTVSTTTATGVIYGSSSVYAGDISSYYVSGASTTGTWSSSDTAVATIDAYGSVTAIATGIAILSYAVNGCGGLAYATDTITVTPLNRISGNIMFSSGAIDTTGGGYIKIWLITYNAATHDLEAADSTYAPIDSTGTIAYYQFLGEVADSYRVKAAYFPATFSTTGYIPTYHTSSLHWSSADVFSHTTSVANDNININMIYGTATTGPGFIGGDVTTGANRGTTGSIPAIGLLMFVVNSGTGAVMQQTFTDATGHYSFSNLPVGQTYLIYPEEINYVTTPYSSIVLSTGATSAFGVGFIKHTVSKTITPVNDAVAPVTDFTPSVVIYPVPSNGKINIMYQCNVTGNGWVNIKDIAGRVVYTTEIMMNKGNGSTALDLTHLVSGMYFVTVKTGEINYTQKIQIVK